MFVVGDMASLNGYPGVAQVAIQGGRYAAARIRQRLAAEPAALGGDAENGSGATAYPPFVYRDKGSMAPISRFSAVASIGRIRLTGFIAWVAWLAVHLVYIIGFKHRVTTLLHWAVSFVGRGRAERTVTVQQIFARNALHELGDDYAPWLGETNVRS